MHSYAIDDFNNNNFNLFYFINVKYFNSGITATTTIIMIIMIIILYSVF